MMAFLRFPGKFEVGLERPTVKAQAKKAASAGGGSL